MTITLTAREIAALRVALDFYWCQAQDGWPAEGNLEWLREMLAGENPLSADEAIDLSKRLALPHHAPFE